MLLPPRQVPHQAAILLQSFSLGCGKDKVVRRGFCRLRVEELQHRDRLAGVFELPLFGELF